MQKEAKLRMVRREGESEGESETRVYNGRESWKPKKRKARERERERVRRERKKRRKKNYFPVAEKVSLFLIDGDIRD